ncbi:MAG TPA: FtsQ-type POTRA domain-containing protein [Kofleriaceae bacterium]|nr:FtsQ-type POTRA domain-containing protein [Kofleriaceae bacterium]
MDRALATDRSPDRSPQGAGRKLGKPARASTPAASRLTVRGGNKKLQNRRKPTPVWSRLPRPKQILDGCGRALRRSVPALVASCIVCALGGGVWLGYRFVTTSDRFAIDDIEIRGTSRLAADDLRASLPVHVGDNVFGVDLDAISQQLRAHPWIDSADVRRILPHTIVVEIHEHQPAAIATLGDLYLVDASGHAFKRFETRDDLGTTLPAITGLERAAYLRDPEATAHQIVDALAVLERWRAAGDRPAIGEVHLDAHGGLTLRTFDSGAAIQLGTLGAVSRDATADVLAHRLHAFDIAWAELSDSERARVRAIHLDARPDHVTVAFTKD